MSVPPPAADHPPSAAFLPVVLATTLVVTINTAIVNVALTRIQTDLGFDAATLSWVVNAYLLTYGGLLIVGGRLSDVIGRRRTLLLGLAVFTIGSGAAALAWDPSSLVAARALQGVGGAVASPAVLAIVTHTFTGHARTKALSWFSVVLGVGFSLGMILGGVIVQWLDWRWVFWLNVPLGVALLTLTPFFVPALRSPDRHRLDLVGAALTIAGTVGVVLAFVQLAGTHRFGPAVVVSLAVSVVAIVGLVLRLRSAAEPLVPLELFARRSIVGAFLANGLAAGALTGVVFFLSQLFGTGLGLAPIAIGSLFIVFTAPQLASALSASRLVRAFGVRAVLRTGLGLATVGMVVLAVAAPSGTASGLLIAGMATTGFGAGVVYFGVNLTVMTSVAPRFAGAASGVVQTSVQLGASVGIAVLVLVQSLAGTGGALLAAAGFLTLAIGAVSLRDRAEPAADDALLDGPSRGDDPSTADDAATREDVLGVRR
ncbi:MFS transporter [Promicromonospora sp. NPDC057488]|uniref:MFS transporter n=1 Tax=Promicromonospora sp. NPDC057488 TaxID=3346147 RepID=UPI00366AD978